MATTNVVNSTRLETLSKDNYDTWRIQVEALLIKNDAWEYVTGEKTKSEIVEGDAASAAAQKTWIVQDRKAKSDLILSINPSELKQIRGCETSKEVWDKLKSIYMSKGPRRKATLLRQLTHQKLEDGDNIREHLSKFSDAVAKLQDLQVDINGDLLSIMLLNSLPNNFENFRSAIESRDNLPETLLDTEALKVKIIEEFDARRQKQNENDSGAMFAKNHYSGTNASREKSNNFNKDDRTTANSRVRYKCNFCKKSVNKADNCFKKNKKLNEKANVGEEDEVYFIDHDTMESAKMSNCIGKSDRWCMDSGCTSHLCNNWDSFTSIKKIQSGLKLASSAVTPVIAKGDVQISTSDGKSSKSIKLKNTLYVPDLRTNLVSIAKIVDNNCKFTFTSERATVCDVNGNVKMIADREGDLYYLRDGSPTACAASNNKPNSEVWHKRFGHLNSKDLTFMMKNKIVSGLEFDEIVEFSPCKSCTDGKLNSTPFPKRAERSSSILDIVHADICGPMRTSSKGGARYILTLSDDYSRWCEVYFLSHKSEVPAKFVEYKNFVENQTGCRIKALQPDNAVDEILKKSGIRRRLTTTYTPQQNGVAERKNRTLIEGARCLLIQSRLQPSFSGEAVATINYIRNRCVSKSLDEGTPYEKWYKRQPDVRHFRIFGSKVKILDKTPNKDKLEPKTLEGIFVGYSDTANAYRMWVPSDGKIKVSRDVVFFDEFENEDKYEDIICKETMNGRFKLFEDLKDAEKNSESIIGPNRQINAEEVIQENIQVNNPVENVNPEVPNPLKRGPGRSKTVKTGLPGRPRKEYHTRNADVDSDLRMNEDVGDDDHHPIEENHQNVEDNNSHGSEINADEN